MKVRMMTIIMTCFFLVACQKTDEKVQSNNEEANKMRESFYGAWIGAIDIPNAPLEIILELDEATGTISIPLQQIKKYPFEQIAYNDSKVEISINLQGQRMVITGEITEDQFSGTFAQNGAVLPLSLQKTVLEEESVEASAVPVRDGELQVVHEFEGDEKEVAIIIAGSGQTDKNGNGPGFISNNYKLIANELVESDIATIRYDKRGVGDNISLVKDPTLITIEDFAMDVASIIDWAYEQGYEKVHVIGHSEGALLATLAAKDREVSTVVLIAGTGRVIDQVMLEQLSATLPPNLLAESEEIMKSVKEGKIVEEMSAELQAFFHPVNQPFLKSWMQINPAEEVKKVKAKKVIIHGTTDIQTNSKDVEALRESVEEVIYIEEMNHILKKAPADREQNLATYADGNLPLHEAFMPALLSVLK